MSRKPKIACSLEPELAFLKNVKGVSAVFNRVFLKIFDCLGELETDRLAAWTALVNGELEIEVSISAGKSSHYRAKKDIDVSNRSPSKEEEVCKEKKIHMEGKNLLEDLVGKFDDFDPNNRTSGKRRY